MERVLFIKQFVAAKPGLDMEHIDIYDHNGRSGRIDRIYFPAYARTHAG